MADISKINAVLLANIAEIDDVLAANIAKVNGLVFTSAPAFSGLLDTYTGAAAAYSTRRLYGQYTGAALRVREDLGDTETDIGFDSNGDLDTAAIATHCGSANGYVTKWYDQSTAGGTGSGNDAAQTTNANQPQVYNGAAVITENGKPALTFDTSDRAAFTSDDISSFFIVSAPTNINTGSVNIAVGLSSALRGIAVAGDSGSRQARAFTNSGTLNITGIGVSADQSLVDYVTTGTSGKLRYNAANELTGSAQDITVDQMGGASTFNMNGNVQEVLMWDTNQDTNRSGIAGNINAHFQIGNFGTPTSGLLATYTGAAAAYSVRQLANTAALAMRIREDGSDTETDIGFDSNGDLDTAAIASHCGSNNGYVVTWYDQAGSQNDATQATTGNQPQIYNGTAVVTDNGKPALDFDGSNDFFGSIAVASATANTLTTVLKPDIVTVGTRKIFARPNSSSGQLRQVTSTLRFLDYELSPTTFSTAEESGISTVQALLFAYVTNTNKTARLGYNGGTFNVGDTLTKDLQVIGTAETDAKLGSHRAGTQEYFDGKMQEFILWTNDQSGSRTGIETDINTYFSIY